MVVRQSLAKTGDNATGRTLENCVMRAGRMDTHPRQEHDKK